MVFSQAGFASPIIDVSCHTAEEIQQAAADSADFAVFGPVFGKQGTDGRATGVQALATACKAAGKMQVLALWGVNFANAKKCIEAGAAGVAGIRLFQDPSIADTVAALRRL